MVLDLNQNTFLLVTGASRGIGQTMAVRLATKLKANSLVVLLARNEEGLAKTKTDIHDFGRGIDVRTFCIDLSTATSDQFVEIMNASLDNGRQASEFERAIIIHNAGTVGDVSKRAIDVADTAIWAQYYHMNVFSAISLNCEFFARFTGVPKLVVNLSSKCAIEPFPSMSFYCSGKAARDMYFKVLAVEETHDTLVLNYAPGAIDTDMTVTVQEETFNSELSAAFLKQRITSTMLTTEQTTEEFLRILEEEKFKSGDHVDFWDY